MRRHRLESLLCGALIMTTVVGCSGLPSTSPVSAGQVVGAADDVEQVAVKPDGPLLTDDAGRIATGFIQAQMDATDNYAVARSFLTGTAASSWHPRDAIRIFESAQDIKLRHTTDHNVTVRLMQTGTMTADGHYNRLPSARPVDITMGVEQTAAGWRVRHIPSELGVWLSDDDVDRLYTQVNIYYPARGSDHLIPDVRRVPRQGMATALARAALAPAPQWLKNAVETPYPTGAKLNVDAVPVSEEGVASVSLTAAAATASAADRKRMWAALTATLLQAPSVTAVDVTTHGGSLAVGGLDTPVQDVSALGFDAGLEGAPAIITRSDSYLAWVRPGTSDSVTGTDAAVARGRPTLPALASTWKNLAAGQSGSVIAGVNSERNTLVVWANNKLHRLKIAARGLVPPLVDGDGNVITIGQVSPKSGPKSTAGRAPNSQTADNTMWVTDGERTVRVPVPSLAGKHVQAWAISPEGGRLAMLVRSADVPRSTTQGHTAADTSTQLVVAAIEHDASGRPVGIGTLQSVTTRLTSLRDVTWADSANLGVLGISENRLMPAVVSLDGQTRTLGVVPRAVGMTSRFAGETGLLVERSDHSVLARVGSSWASYLGRGEIITPLS